ncbi:MAG: serine hydrolase [Rhizobacter sp.]|nr:serine hydrolase [Ferruginibacter sp.]
MKLLLSLILFYSWLLPTITAQPKSVEKNIIQVENSLMPFVPVKDFSGWNIKDRMKYYKVPGVSIAVIRNYKIEWAKGYGLADTSARLPVTVKTLFSAGSISKLLMAATALKMVEQSRIELDSNINKYLVSWHLKENDFTLKKPVTLRMLLSHSAGTSQSSYFGFTPNQKLPSIVEILSGAKIATSRPVVVNSETGKAFRYSGGGSMIAQMALMDVSKKSFSALTETLLFKKLGMKNSTFEQPLTVKFSRQAAGAYSSASWFKGMPYVYPQQAAAGLYSTPTDLAKFFIDIQKSYTGKGKILSQRTVRQMLTPQFDVSDGSYKEQIGIGPFLMQRTDNKDAKGIYFEFTGVNAGFLAYGIASVEGGNGVVIMMNSGDDVNGFGKELRRSVAKTYSWTNFLPQEIVPVQLPDEQLEKLAGRYRMSANEVLYLKKENKYFIENINEGNDIYCFPVSKDTIVFTDYNIRGFFTRNEKGEVTGLQNIYQDKPMPKMKPNEFSPGEYLKMKQYQEAKKAFALMNMNEYQITYLAYDLLNKKPLDVVAVRTVLELATEQHPLASIVYSRWGDYYLKINDKVNAIISYKKALQQDPSDEQTKVILEELMLQ